MWWCVILQYSKIYARGANRHRSAVAVDVHSRNMLLAPSKRTRDATHAMQPSFKGVPCTTATIYAVTQSQCNNSLWLLWPQKRAVLGLCEIAHGTWYLHTCCTIFVIYLILYDTVMDVASSYTCSYIVLEINVKTKYSMWYRHKKVWLLLRPIFNITLIIYTVPGIYTLYTIDM